MSDHDAEMPVDNLDERLEAGLRAAFAAPSPAPDLEGRALQPAHLPDGLAPPLLREELDGDSSITVSPLAADADVDAFRGRYQILGEIARGGMGIVLKGRDQDLCRDVALKVLHPKYAEHPSLIRRFVEEAQIGGQLQHPGVLPVYDFGLDRNCRPYFATRLVRGRNLRTLLNERPAIDHDRGRFLNIFEQVCQAVAYAHSRGVIHRDLKPENVMVGAFGEVQIVDWGLAKVIDAAAETDAAQGMPTECEEQVSTLRSAALQSHSDAGSMLGTPAYMSPEQARGERAELDERTDVFALGAMLCEILTGRPPYLGTRAEVLRLAAEGNLGDAFIRLETCDAEGELIDLAKRCLAPGKADRPRQAGLVADEVSSYFTSMRKRAQAAEVAAAEARATAAVERKMRRRTTGLAVALGLALLGGALFAVMAERQRRARAEQSIAEVNAIMHKVDWFRGEIPFIPPDQLERWWQALAQVRNTA